MAGVGIQLAGVRATLNAAALAERQIGLRVHGGLLRLSDEGLALLLRPTGLATIDRISGGHAFLRLSYQGIHAIIEVWPSASMQGRLRLEPVSVRAGFFPLPAATVGLILGALRDRLADKPWIHLVQGNVPEIDFSELA